MIGVLALTFLDAYGDESIYIAAFMIAMCAAMMLGRWTTKRLLIFMFVIATLIAVIAAVKDFMSRAVVYQTYAVSLPSTTNPALVGTLK